MGDQQQSCAFHAAGKPFQARTTAAGRHVCSPHWEAEVEPSCRVVPPVAQPMQVLVLSQKEPLGQVQPVVEVSTVLKPGRCSLRWAWGFRRCRGGRRRS